MWKRGMCSEDGDDAMYCRVEAVNSNGRILTCCDLFLFFHSRVRVRYQKRQKLQFETKLGMNSPF